MKKEPTIFSKNLDFLMTNSGVEVADLAKTTGVSVQNVNNWLNGRNSPGNDKLNAIGERFGVLPFDLKTKDLTIQQNIDVDIVVIKKVLNNEAYLQVVLRRLSDLIVLISEGKTDKKTVEDQSKKEVKAIHEGLVKELGV